MARHILCLTFNINVDKKDRLDPEEYMPLPGDPIKKPKGYIPPEIFIGMMRDVFGQQKN